LYLITFGIEPAANASYLFELRITSPVVATATYQKLNLTTSGGTELMHNLTIILNIPSNPTQLQLINNSGSARTINNSSNVIDAGPAAYVTIVKLK